MEQQQTKQTFDERKLRATLKKSNEALEGILKGILIAFLVIAIAVVINIPGNTSGVIGYARKFCVHVISQLTRLFPQSYAEAESWKERANSWAKVYTEISDEIFAGGKKVNAPWENNRRGEQ